MEKCILEERLSGIGDIGPFDEAANFLSRFSERKTLYSYQREALYNCLKLLYVYYHEYRSEGENVGKSKKNLMRLYQEYDPGFSWDNRLKKYANERRGIRNDKFTYFVSNRYFEPSFANDEEFIDAGEFYNRCAFWMATGSGKSVVIIKLIDLLKKLMDWNLIPKKPILLLTPREYIIRQIIEEAEEFNRSPGNADEIDFVSLKEYESYDKPVSASGIDVFYYRSDLIRDKTTDNFISAFDIDHNGDWYVILDEAHRGDNDLSLAKGYFTALTRRGFLFNFSATFADAIDFQTTLYNFNLEKFIEHQYGKNILVSKTLYTFKKSDSEPDELEKQKEVLKSFIVYTAVKQTKTDPKRYHAPLLMTLVGTVNTKNSDLKVYFRIMELLVTGKIKKELFLEAKQELLENEFSGEKVDYSLGTEKLNISDPVYAGNSFRDLIRKTQIHTILVELFNANTFGRIEFIHSEDIREIGMKLETSDQMFGLIKIGERDRFEKSIIGDEDNYSVTKSISTKCIFDRLETDAQINMLCGSRAFYEGWDTNRPNVLNLIDIGSKDAQKFVPQAIGRGIRIKPTGESRKRLGSDDDRKNQLLETLFVFATNKDVVDTIVGMKGSPHHAKREHEAVLPKKKEKSAEQKGNVRDVPKFYLSKSAYQLFREFFMSYRKELLFVKYGLEYRDYLFIRENLTESIEDSALFALSGNAYSDMQWLLRRVISHIRNRFVEEM